MDINDSKGIQIDDDGLVVSDPIQRAINNQSENVKVSHPLEQVFDIEPGSTELSILPPRDTALVECQMYDEKDRELEENFQEVYDKAMDAFDDMNVNTVGIEGRYQARNNEVSVMMLNTALAAAKAKARMKEHKDKISTHKGSGNGLPGTTNNTVVISSSDLIKQLAASKSPINNEASSYGADDAVDGEVVEDESRTKRQTIKRKRSDSE